MKPWAVTALLMCVGCKSLQRLPGLESPNSTPNADATNPNDFTLTGTVDKDHASIYTPVTGRTITVDVLRPSETQWVRLTQPDTTDKFDEYQLFTIPMEGVHFGDKAEIINGTLYMYSGTPAVPTGSLYKIHNVKTV